MKKLNLVETLQEDFNAEQFVEPRMDYYKTDKTYDEVVLGADDFTDPADDEYERIFTKETVQTPRAPEGETLRFFGQPNDLGEKNVLALRTIQSNTYGNKGKKTWGFIAA